MTNLAYTVIDAADSSLNKTSVLVTGETEALIVDAAFTRADGHRIVAEVLDSGKRLTTVFISAGDPDFYFGAEVIADAFPEATFVAPADVIEHIEHSYQGKLQAWAHLGANLPTRLVDLVPLTEQSFTVDGTTIEVRRGSDQLGDRAWYLFEPDFAVPGRRRPVVRRTARVDRRQFDTRAARRMDSGAERPRGTRSLLRRRRSPARGHSDRPHRHPPYSPLPRAVREDHRGLR